MSKVAHTVCDQCREVIQDRPITVHFSRSGSPRRRHLDFCTVTCLRGFLARNDLT